MAEPHKHSIHAIVISRKMGPPEGLKARLALQCYQYMNIINPLAYDPLNALGLSHF